MAEANTAELNAKADAAFALGFDDTPPVAKVVEEPKVEPAKPVGVVPAVVPKPEYVRLTKQEWDNTKAAAGKVSILESQVAKLAGSMPKAEQIIQQALQRVQSQTPAGVSVEFSDEDFAELAEDFPDVAKMTRAGLERIFKKANVRGTGAPNGALDADAIEKAVDATLKKRADAEAAAVVEKEMTGLLEVYPDWGKIVGQPNAMGTKTPVDTDWRKWATINDHAALKTDSPAEVQASIAKFMASQTTTATVRPDKAAARRAVISDAVTPRADGNPPPLNPRESAEDAFGKAFAAAKRH